MQCQCTIDCPLHGAALTMFSVLFRSYQGMREPNELKNAIGKALQAAMPDMAAPPASRWFGPLPDSFDIKDLYELGSL